MSEEVEKNPEFVKCEIFTDEMIMFSDTVPTFDVEKKRVTFPKVYMKDCFYSKYMGEDFRLEVYESVSDEPTIYVYDAGIMKFGMITLTDTDNGRVICVENMEFEYDWANDILERIGVGDKDISELN